MALVLYAATAAALLWLTQRFVMPLGRGTAAILVLLPLCFTGRALLTGAAYGPLDLPYLTEPLREMRVPLGVPEPQNRSLTDLYAQMIPWRKAVQYALAQRQWPLWNPFILSGSVLAASAQPAAYSPFTLLACLLPIADSLTYSAAITFFIAALGAFLFAREIGCRPSAALVASAGFAYSTSIAFFVLWAVGGSWAFLPLVLLGARRCVWRPGVPSAVLLMIALTLLLLAGHPETALHAVFIGAIYGAFELARRREQVVAPIVCALAGAGISLLLTAVYILPIIDSAPQTEEYQFRMHVWSSWPRGIATEETVARIATDVFPAVYGMSWKFHGVGNLPLDSAAVGSIVLAASIYAIARARRPETWFFSAVAVFGFLARASWTPLSNTLRLLPLFNATINERFCFAAACALSILAAIGIEELLRRGGDRVASVVFAGVLIAITAGTLYIRSSGVVSINNFPEWGHYAVFAEIGCLAIAALIVMWRPHFLLPILLVQRFLAVGDVYPTLPRWSVYPPIPILEPLKLIREPFRIVAHAFGFVPGTSALYELEDARGYEALTLGRYLDTYDLWCVGQPVWFNRIDNYTRPFLSFLNVRYCITSQKAPVPPGWHIAAEQRGSRLLENERVLPRAFIPGRTVVGRNPLARTLEEMMKATDFREVAWIEAPMPLHEERNGAGMVSIERRRNGFRLRVSMEQPGRVVVSEPAWKGWRAYIDGRRIQMQIANLAFLGIYVPPGHHTIRLIYLPESFVIGRAISGATVIILILFGFLRWRRRGLRIN